MSTVKTANAHLDYWIKRIADAPLILDLPTDKPRATIEHYSRAIATQILPDSLCNELFAFSENNGVTLFVTLLTGFANILARMSGQKDVLIWTSVNMTCPHHDSFSSPVSILPLRLDLSGQPTGEELLGRVRNETLEAYAHQEVPFEQIVEALQPSRDLSRNPLVQVLFQLDNMPEDLSAFLDMQVTILNIAPHLSKFDLMLTAFEQQGQIELALEYNRDLFREASMQRLLAHYQVLLEALVQQPHLPIGRLPWLTEAERHHLLIAWNATQVPYPQQPLPHLFSQQAARQPEALALVCGQQQMRYGQLEAQANQLAHYLQQQGVGTETLVAVALPRSCSLIVALLAILKAGGAYVPLDPTYPAQRLQYILQQTQAPVLLTQSGVLAAPVLEHYTGRVVEVEREAERIGQQPTTPPPCPVGPDHLAYVIYTSGSTGQPKGVMIQHRSICRLLFGCNYVHLDEQQTLLHMAPTAFDASTFEIWGALLHGACCVLFPDQVPTPDQIARLLHQHQVTTLWLTASLFNLLMDDAPHILSGVRQLLVGGEALSIPHIYKALQMLPNTQLINGYGPTETTTFAICYPIPAHLSKESLRSIPIGRPISNTQVYVLDEYLEPVPVGVTGEIYIGGAGVARGYLNAADLTAQRFLPDPFSSQPGARLYQTGDLARYLPDGRLEFLGRGDAQVKLRGYRIELGEIEAVLTQQPGIQQAVVLLREEAPIGKHLVAYLVGQPQLASECEQLRQALARWLPDYMIPAQFVLLEQLPLSANGKVDRHALLARELEAPSAESAYVAPRTPTEEILAQVWAQVLGRERVGIHENFFALGGHSLLAMQLILRMGQALGVNIPVRTLFATPTIAGLVQTLKLTSEEDTTPALPLVPVERTEPLPLSYIQERLWLLSEMQPGNPVSTTSFLLHLEGPLDVECLDACIQAIVRRHEILRTTYQIERGKLVQIIAPEVHIPIRITSFEELQGIEKEIAVRKLLNAEHSRRFNLKRNPVLRVHLLRLSEREHFLMTVLPHMAVDGRSFDVFFHELVAHYQGMQEGTDIRVPSLPIQYADYAVWERKQLKGDVLQKLLTYWTKQLANAPAELKLPTDKPQPAVLRYRAMTCRVFLPSQLSELLRKFSAQEGVTMFMTLLTGFALMLARLTGQYDLLIGTPAARRTRIEIENLIGIFADMLTLRINLSDAPTGRELLHRVREVTVGAFEHQDLPSIKLVRALQGMRGNTPLYRAVFGMYDMPVLEQTIGELTISTALFDQPGPLEMEMRVEEKKQKIQLELSYNTDLFSEERIMQILQQFQDILAEIATNPQVPVIH